MPLARVLQQCCHVLTGVSRMKELTLWCTDCPGMANRESDEISLAAPERGPKRATEVDTLLVHTPRTHHAHSLVSRATGKNGRVRREAEAVDAVSVAVQGCASLLSCSAEEEQRQTLMRTHLPPLRAHELACNVYAQSGVWAEFTPGD